MEASAPSGPGTVGAARMHPPPFALIWEELWGTPRREMTGGVEQAPHPGTGSDMQHISLGPIPALPVRLIPGVQPGRPRDPHGRYGGWGRGVLRTQGKPEKLQERKSRTGKCQFLEVRFQSRGSVWLACSGRPPRFMLTAPAPPPQFLGPLKCVWKPGFKSTLVVEARPSPSASSCLKHPDMHLGP